MLVISRKKGESLLIGDDIEITVEKIDENSNAIATTKDILKILK